MGCAEVVTKFDLFLSMGVTGIGFVLLMLALDSRLPPKGPKEGQQRVVFWVECSNCGNEFEVSVDQGAPPRGTCRKCKSKDAPLVCTHYRVEDGAK